MNRSRAWAAAIALVVGCLAQPLCAQESATTPPTESKPWFQRMFGKSEPKKATTPLADEKKTPKQRPSEAAALMLGQEQADYLRRLEVITQFKQIALQNGDDKLLREAETLEREATEVYQQRIAHLPCARLKPTPEQELDATLGSGIASTPLKSGNTLGKTAQAGLGSKEGNR